MYGDLAASKTYHAARGNEAWADAADSDLEIALLRGAEYIDQRYRSSFPGHKTDGRDQVREWPRLDAHDREGYPIPADDVPQEIEHAAYEAALRELQNPGSLSPDLITGRQRKSVSVSGAVAETYVGPVGAEAMRPMLTILAGILAPILTGQGGSSVSGRTYRV